MDKESTYVHVQELYAPLQLYQGHNGWFGSNYEIKAPSNLGLREFPSGIESITATPKEGLFVLKIGTSLELWDMVSAKNCEY